MEKQSLREECEKIGFLVEHQVKEADVGKIYPDWEYVEWLEERLEHESCRNVSSCRTFELRSKNEQN